MSEIRSDKSACGRPEVSVRLVTSLDSPYAILDCLKQSLGTVKNQLLISAPWAGKGFVSFLRDVVPTGVEVYFLTKLPEKKDYSFQAVDSLLEIADSKGWKVNIRCNSKLHSKFFVIDDSTCISGSVNPTESGILYNHEHLTISRLQDEVTGLSDYFFKLWKQPDNIGWQHVRQFHGYKVMDRRSVLKDIAERIEGFFLSNGNSPTPKWKVCKEIVRLGYEESDIITVMRSFIQDGILYEPKLDYICLASAHLD
jgi:hypothetical protein